MKGFISIQSKSFGHFGYKVYRKKLNVKSSNNKLFFLIVGVCAMKRLFLLNKYFEILKQTWTRFFASIKQQTSWTKKIGKTLWLFWA